MMIKKIITLLVLMVAIDVYASQMSESMAMLMQDNDIPGATVQLYVGGKLQSYYFGYADKAKKVPMSAKTLFLLDPLAELMTSILLAQQVDTASMQLDEGITDYVATAPESDAAMTLQNLATYSDDTVWRYSRTNSQLLNAALEKNTHKKID